MTKPTPKVAHHIPEKGTKQYLLLQALLGGVRVDPFLALMEWNLPTLNARASELRRLGWPVRSIELPHPKVKGEKIVAFVLDEHFRQWMKQNPAKHPAEYPFKEGRGKFESWTPEQFINQHAQNTQEGT